jgi:hypothetical protein
MISIIEGKIGIKQRKDSEFGVTIKKVKRTEEEMQKGRGFTLDMRTGEKKYKN